MYALASFLSAALLFLIEPLFAKMVLPLLGGSPAVWTTCMLFFQAVLLAGYAYAHLTTLGMGLGRQAALHLVLVLLPFLVLPITVAGQRPPTNGSPVPWLLGVLAASVGLPFFVVSTSGPLLQKWFTASEHSSAGDPYFFYAAGNLGSILALLSYPFVLEPLLALPSHARIWTAGYGLLVILIAACALSVLRAGKDVRTLFAAWRLFHSRSSSEKGPDAFFRPEIRDRHSSATTHQSPLTTHQRLHWVALAFVPSSLMLSVTTYLTTDIAAIPLLWVIPLALYLLSFVLVFARKQIVPPALPVRILPLVMLVLTLALLAQATEPIWLLLPLHLAAFFVIAVMCHGQLARRRPGAEHLTEYYFWLAAGGVLGGIFNALVAPLIFPTVIEYPLVLVLACLLRPPLAQTHGPLSSEPPPALGRPHKPDAPAKQTAPPSLAQQVRALAMDVALALALGLVTIGLVYVIPALRVSGQSLRLGLVFGLPAVLCYLSMARPIRFGLGLGALFLAGAFYQGTYGATLLCRRSFFGIHRVTLDPSRTQHLLVHGSTVHGRQNLTEALRHQPLTYYHRTGPIGRVFASFRGDRQRKRIAIVGLGAGSLAAYGQPGQEFTFYEIDPIVEQIARDERYFTFLRDCRAHLEVIRGDARLKLQEDGPLYDLLVIDAFTSDAIPLHLLTREALEIYRNRLAPGGLLAFNVSNRYLDLEPVLGDLAGDAGWLAWAANDLTLTREEQQEGKSASQWVLMARSATDLGPLSRSGRWAPLRPRPAARVWTDDFSNLFGVFRWIE